MASPPTHFFDHPAVSSARQLALVSRGRLVLTRLGGGLLALLIVAELIGGWLVPDLALRLGIGIPLLGIHTYLWMALHRKHLREALHASMNWEMYRFLGDLQVKSSTHQGALAILKERADTGAPFALYLRNFDIEAQWRLTQKGTGSHGAEQNVAMILGGKRRMEEGLAGALEGRISVFAIANPDDLHGSGKIPRLVLPNEGWKDVLESLIKAAAFIVMNAESVRPGVLAELEMIRAAGREQDTFVILSSQATQKDRESSRDLAFRDVKKDEITVEYFDRHHPALSGFSRITTDDTIDFARLDQEAPFAGLLEGAAATQARVAHSKGTSLLDQGKPDEARKAFLQSAALSRTAGSKSEQAAALCNAAQAGLQEGDAASALTGFEESARLSREAGDRRSEALATSRAGRALLALGREDEALEKFSAAAEIQREVGPAEEYVGSLSYIAKVYLDSGRFVESEPHFERMLEAAEEAGYALGIAKAWEGLGLGHIQRQSLEHAVYAFDRAYQASRVAGDRELEALSAQILAGTLRQTGDFVGAAAASAGAVEALEALGKKEEADSIRKTRVTELYNGGVTLLDGPAPEIPRAIQLLEQALAASRQEELSELEEISLFRLGMAHTAAKAFGVAIPFFQASIEVSGKRGNPERAALSEANIGAIHLEEGRTDEAVTWLTQAVAFQRQGGKPIDLAYTLGKLSDAYRQAGDLDAALGVDGELLELYQATGDRQKELGVLHGLGTSLFEMGRRDEAVGSLEKAVALADEMDRPDVTAACMVFIGKCHESQGDVEGARRRYEEALRTIRGKGFGELEGKLKEIVGQAYP